VGVVLALMAEADVLILDEPTSGLDPLAQREVLEILREVRDRGSTVFFSSHNLTEVERICDRVGMIRAGRLVAVQRVEEVTSKRRTVLDVTFREAPPTEAFAGLPGVVVASGADGAAMRIEIEGEVDGLVKALARHHVVAIETVQPSLEEEFLALYERDAAKEGT
jgi:ABC-2 type transport system ATP-binding protein